VPKVFGDLPAPIKKMDPNQVGLQLEMPIQSQRKGAILKCETPGCTKRDAPLDENFKTVGINVCAACLGIPHFSLVSELRPHTAASKLAHQMAQPQVSASPQSRHCCTSNTCVASLVPDAHQGLGRAQALTPLPAQVVLALVGSALGHRPYTPKEFDRNVAYAKAWCAIVGIERGFRSMGIGRHMNKLMPAVTIQEAYYAVHQLTWLDRIDKALAQQMVELGCTHHIRTTTPARAARRSFQKKRDMLMHSYPSAILVVPYPNKDQVRSPPPSYAGLCQQSQCPQRPMLLEPAPPHPAQHPHPPAAFHSATCASTPS